jgi:hypothetical protein
MIDDYGNMLIIRSRNMRGMSEPKHKPLNLACVSDLLIAWEQYKKANWYESKAIDVEKKLMHDFQAIYKR